MSILIRGMEMPTSCRTCPMKMNCDDCEGWECVCVPLHKQIGYFDDLLTDKRRDDCPLVPVLPHGRLIDADEAIGHLFNGEQCLYSWDEIEDAIDATVTIIPAEPPKEGS